MFIPIITSHAYTKTSHIYRCLYWYDVTCLYQLWRHMFILRRHMFILRLTCLYRLWRHMFVPIMTSHVYTDYDVTCLYQLWRHMFIPIMTSHVYTKTSHVYTKTSYVFTDYDVTCLYLDVTCLYRLWLHMFVPIMTSHAYTDYDIKFLYYEAIPWMLHNETKTSVFDNFYICFSVLINSLFHG